MLKLYCYKDKKEEYLKWIDKYEKMTIDEKWETFTNEGDTVLDFCMGSGSSGEAALNCGRNFIGIEKDENYFQICLDRLGKLQ